MRGDRRTGTRWPRLKADGNDQADTNKTVANFNVNPISPEPLMSNPGTSPLVKGSRMAFEAGISETAA
jgi:hypothetical protein